MADDFDNTDDIENLTDAELREYIVTRLREQPLLGGDSIGVFAHGGQVTVTGSVGTEEELRILDHVLTDTLGLTDVTNNVMIGELYRAESPEAIDEHIADEDETSGLLLGDESVPYTDESAHLASDADIDSMDNVGGTHDVSEAIEGAEPWIPPDGPTPEGFGGQEQGNFGIDARH